MFGSLVIRTLGQRVERIEIRNIHSIAYGFRGTIIDELTLMTPCISAKARTLI